MLYFTEDEFRRCTPACSMRDMHVHSLNRLDKLRDLAGMPIILNSAYRSVSYEKIRCRSGTSSHCKGRAFDIRCSTDRDRFTIVWAALRAGFTRVGIASTYIHVDDDPDKPSAVWLY